MSRVKFVAKSPDMMDFEDIVFDVNEIRAVQPYNYKGKFIAILKTIYNAEYIVRMDVEKVIERINSKRK